MSVVYMREPNLYSGQREAALIISSLWKSCETFTRSNIFVFLDLKADFNSVNRIALWHNRMLWSSETVFILAIQTFDHYVPHKWVN